MFRTTFLASFMLLLALATDHACAGESPGIKLDIVTSLGVKKSIDVYSVSTNDDLVNRAGGRLDRHWVYEGSIATGFLAIRSDDKSTVLIPWGQVKDVSVRDKKHVIATTESTEYVGKIITFVTSDDDDDNERFDEDDPVHDLSAVTSMKVSVQHTPVTDKKPKKPTDKKPKKPSEWSATRAAHDTQPVSQPRFVFQYHGRDAFINIGTTREVIASDFRITVDGDTSRASIDDFQFVEIGGAADKPTITVQAAGGQPVTGTLELSVVDDGTHLAFTWALLVDLRDGCRLLLPPKSPCKLQRK